MTAKIRNVRRLNTNREKAWKVMRAMPTFTIADIATLIEVPVDNIRHYIDCLLHAGYIRKAGKKRIPCRSGIDNIYRLIKNTGPKPPVQKALRFLYDPNTKEYWSENPELMAILSAFETVAEVPELPAVRGSIKKYVPLLCPRKKKEAVGGGEDVA